MPAWPYRRDLCDPQSRKAASRAILNSRPERNRRIPMIGNRICVIALAAACATICSPPSAIAAPFDGNWSVVAQTTQGHCGSIHFGLAIDRGRLYSAGGYYVGGYPAQLGGRVSPSG